MVKMHRFICVAAIFVATVASIAADASFKLDDSLEAEMDRLIQASDEHENRQLDFMWTLPPDTEFPTNNPTKAPTKPPTVAPTGPPTKAPTGSPTKAPTGSPTGSPTMAPTVSPTGSPTKAPTVSPTGSPTMAPTGSPTGSPTKAPTGSPTGSPTMAPTGSPTGSPTMAPTGSPTVSPTKAPTGSPTVSPTGSPTRMPTEPSSRCGTVKAATGFLMGPSAYDSDTDNDETCALKAKSTPIFRKSVYAPSWMYTFELTSSCEYMFLNPLHALRDQASYVTDQNVWFDQVAASLERPGTRAYSLRGDTLFTGLTVPNVETDLKITNIFECPEEYCVEVSGKAVGQKFENEIIENSATMHWAFSDRQAWMDFYKFMKAAMNSPNAKQIFLTNDYTRCGCKSYCHDDDGGGNSSKQATCYQETQCGTRTLQIDYSPSYPESSKPSWAETGTTHVMEWFSECASAMYGCKLSADSKPFERYQGGVLPQEYTMSSTGSKHTYGLGGSKRNGGFLGGDDSAQLMWECPSEETLSGLTKFSGELMTKGLFYDNGLSETVPTLPCKDDTIPPVTPPPGTGPFCGEIVHNGFCMELQKGTCYIREPKETCSAVDFVYTDGTQTIVTGDVAEWSKTCLTEGLTCKVNLDAWDGKYAGTLNYKGMPKEDVLQYDKDTWQLWLRNSKNSKDEQTMIPKDAITVYNCDSWVDAYGARNFVTGAGDYYTHFNNNFGDLFAVEPGVCTDSPSARPSSAPPTTGTPSTTPTMAPTNCRNSYLDTPNLNLNLVVDLSYSTYKETFSSHITIGDVNGDGKGDTILDAQVLAIQDLLQAITDSSTLSNENSEISLISFHTDAKSHGVWSASNPDGTGVNEELMTYIKKELRAPRKSGEVQKTNNGFTNFDAALDRSVEYFRDVATPDRKNLLVFLSDGEPNVRGDGDNEGYCAEEVLVWFDKGGKRVNCTDLNIAPGAPHDFCRADDRTCGLKNEYQDCVRGPRSCQNNDAATQYTSEITALEELNVERLAIGVGSESNVAQGSALWMIDNNPAKDLGVLPIQALDFMSLSNAVKNLCILDTKSPTTSPSVAPSTPPTMSPAPSSPPTKTASSSPTDIPSSTPTEGPKWEPPVPQPTSEPTKHPTESPTKKPTNRPTNRPTTSAPTKFPTKSPTTSPSERPSDSPTPSPSSTPTFLPSSSPTKVPTGSPSENPTGSFFPSTAPTDAPTVSPAPSVSPTDLPSAPPSLSPTMPPTLSPTTTPSSSPSSKPTDMPSLSPTEYPSESPSAPPTKKPSQSPSAPPSESNAPTFFLPECYDAPKLVGKDSSDTDMCFYNRDMVGISNMTSTDVTIRVNNVWKRTVMPADVRVFIHTNGVNAVNGGGSGFECLRDDGDAVDLVSFNDMQVQCHKEEGGQWLAVVDVVVIDEAIQTNEIRHPCYPDKKELANSCSWRLIIPCDTEDLCSAEPTGSPSVSPTALPSSGPTPSPTDTPTRVPTVEPSASPSTMHPSKGPTGTPTTGTPTTGTPTTGTPTTGTPTTEEDTGIHPTLAPRPTPNADKDPTPAPVDINIRTRTPTIGPAEMSPSSSPTAGSSWLLSSSPGPTADASDQTPSLVPLSSPSSLPLSSYPSPVPSAGDSWLTSSSSDPTLGVNDQSCPTDIIMIKTEAVTAFPKDTVKILKQEGTSVTVDVSQHYTDSSSTIESIYYQYQPDAFNRKCYEQKNVPGEKSFTLTIDCSKSTKVALLELWFADKLEKKVFVKGDDAVVPECCHPTIPKDMPVTKYFLEIKCVTTCVDAVL